ncbi:MAG: TlpA family protein disulfide reductase [Candidatus Limnocylindrus sp.]
MIGPFPRRALARIVVVAIGIAILLGLAGTSVPIPGSSGTGFNEQGQYVIDPDTSGPLLGSQFLIPPNQPSADGETYGDLIASRRVAGLEGPRLIIVDFFATWCPPCQQETPTLRSLDRAYRDEGLLLVGISVQELRETVRGYAERYEIEYPILLDVDGALFRAALAGGLPTKILLDAEGRVLQVLPRPFTPEDGPNLIAPLLRVP